ncbi:MAG: hypothetical protein ACE5FT_00690 [Candidatus Nanoarchaeia archaeon]
MGHGYPFEKSNILPSSLFLYPQYNILLYDHRYFGESDGFYSTASLKETVDVEAAIKFTKKHYGAKHKIALW